MESAVGHGCFRLEYIHVQISTFLYGARKDKMFGVFWVFLSKIRSPQEAKRVEKPRATAPSRKAGMTRQLSSSKEDDSFPAAGRSDSNPQGHGLLPREREERPSSQGQ
jgi:hypothetical protein